MGEYLGGELHIGKPYTLTLPRDSSLLSLFFCFRFHRSWKCLAPSRLSGAGHILDRSP
jgi:hypothetical protein